MGGHFNQLICPPVDFPSLALLSLSPPIDSFVEEGDEWRFFGNELKAAHLLQRLALARGVGGAVSDNLGRLFTRPAVEPILARRFDFLTERISLTRLQVLASELLGHGAILRAADIFGSPDLKVPQVKFAPLEAVNHLPRRLETILSAEIPVMVAAWLCFVEVIVSHPFEDGNGRLARAFFHIVLGAKTKLCSLALPLGPAFIANADVLSDSLIALSHSGDWSTFLRDTAIVMDQCEAIARGIVD
ncbi:Fic family protein [Rhizobium leguminosarum]